MPAGAGGFYQHNGVLASLRQRGGEIQGNGGFSIPGQQAGYNQTPDICEMPAARSAAFDVVRRLLRLSAPANVCPGIFSGSLRNSEKSCIDFFRDNVLKAQRACISLS